MNFFIAGQLILFVFGQKGGFGLHGTKDHVGSGPGNTGKAFDLAVDLLQVFGGGDDFQHKVKISGDIITGGNVFGFGDHIRKGIVIFRMLQGDLHQSNGIIADGLLVDQNRVGGNDAAFFQLSDPFGDGRNAQTYLVADLGSLHSCVLLELCKNLNVNGIQMHHGYSSLSFRDKYSKKMKNRQE